MGYFLSIEYYFKCFIKCYTIYKDTHIYSLFSLFFVLGRAAWRTSLQENVVYAFGNASKQFLEFVGLVFLRSYYSCVFPSSLLRRYNVYCRKTHVCVISVCNVFEIFGSFPHPQKTGANTYDDQRDGIY